MNDKGKPPSGKLGGGREIVSAADRPHLQYTPKSGGCQRSGRKLASATWAPEAEAKPAGLGDLLRQFVPDMASWERAQRRLHLDLGGLSDAELGREAERAHFAALWLTDVEDVAWCQERAGRALAEQARRKRGRRGG